METHSPLNSHILKHMHMTWGTQGSTDTLTYILYTFMFVPNSSQKYLLLPFLFILHSFTAYYTQLYTVFIDWILLCLYLDSFLSYTGSSFTVLYYLKFLYYRINIIFFSNDKLLLPTGQLHQVLWKMFSPLMLSLKILFFIILF